MKLEISSEHIAMIVTALDQRAVRLYTLAQQTNERRSSDHSIEENVEFTRSADALFKCAGEYDKLATLIRKKAT